MAAMKPRTGDGPLEVTKEGRGIVMRVPARGRWPSRRRAERRRSRRAGRCPQGGRGLTCPRPTTVLPAQVSPPAFALSGLPPHELPGVEVLALPFTVADDDAVLGAGAGGGAGDALGLDLAGRAGVAPGQGQGGEVVAVPVGGPGNSGLRLVLLVGLGEEHADRLPPRRCRRRPRDLRPRVGGDHGPGRRRRRGADGVRRRRDAGLLRLPLALAGSRARAGTPVVLAGLPDDDHAAALERGLALGGAGWRSRMLATVPSNLKSPQWLAEQAERARRRERPRRRGLGREQARQAGLRRHPRRRPGLGDPAAADPARLHAPPAGRKAPRVVLVGKGITFDTGGLSIKPAEGMITMKRDMTGGAVVMAVMGAPRRAGLPWEQ